MKSSSICQDWLDSLPPTEGYLKKEQSIGREFLLEKGMPSKKDEAWRLSNFNKLNSFFSLPIIVGNVRKLFNLLKLDNRHASSFLEGIPFSKRNSRPIVCSFFK